MALLAAHARDIVHPPSRLSYSLVVLRGTTDSASDNDSASSRASSVVSEEFSSCDDELTSETCSANEATDFDSGEEEDVPVVHSQHSNATADISPQATHQPILENDEKIGVVTAESGTDADGNSQPLTEYQMKCLRKILTSTCIIHGGRPYPNLAIRPIELVADIQKRLQAANGISVVDVRLNGSAATHIVGCVEPNQNSPWQRPPAQFNDLDFLFMVDFDDENSGKYFDVIRDTVLESLKGWFARCSDENVSPLSLQSAYVTKLFRVPTKWSQTEQVGDCWSIMSLRNMHGRNIELKFVKRIRRNYEFSVDSFQVILTSLLNERDESAVRVESAYGPLNEALCHLHERHIYTKSPEELRGGGLLKYCCLLASGFRLPLSMSTHDREQLLSYMTHRFLIDFGTNPQQLTASLLNYIDTHMASPIAALRYLTAVYDVMSTALGTSHGDLLSCVSQLRLQCACAVESSQPPYMMSMPMQPVFAVWLPSSPRWQVPGSHLYRGRPSWQRNNCTRQPMTSPCTLPTNSSSET